MDTGLLKILFQEKSVISKLLEQPLATVSHAELLEWLNGDGPRLDQLLRHGIVLRLGVEYGPGVVLLLLHQAQNGLSAEALYQQWTARWQQLRLLADDIQRSGPDPAARNAVGENLPQQLLILRSWTRLLLEHVNALTEAGMQPEVLATIQQAMEQLGSWQLHNASFPAWEAEQQALMAELEAGIDVMKTGGNGATDSPRLAKLRHLTALEVAETEQQTNLRHLLDEAHVLALHKDLGILAYPDPEIWRNNVVAPSGSEASMQGSPVAGPDLVDLTEEWKQSGQDLHVFLQQQPVLQNDASRRMAVFAELLKKAGPKAVWKKNNAGTTWEVWWVEGA